MAATNLPRVLHVSGFDPAAKKASLVAEIAGILESHFPDKIDVQEGDSIALHFNEAETAECAAKALRERFTVSAVGTFDPLQNSCSEMLRAVGENPAREGLLKTPLRWAKALRFLTSGYGGSVATIVNDAVFTAESRDMVCVRNVTFFSLCEHHLLPFWGSVNVGYVPNGKILGLSKVARIVEVYARRLQIQERLTREIAKAIVDLLDPLGVGVNVEANHMCMAMRGVQQWDSSTSTTSVLGIFESDARTRSEFLDAIKMR
eukprot:NODE_1579_length_1485_cov_19.481894_g1425_i0.p1 GENE.NODE_1579_length_1485_cov_19.481894_g1425_i0~~NODE_1579_length_1485_cov_19.481894_g1425_i0.p1  ORF type:complete len:261 (+),score=51.06 NODE_1579_length_1485_cov_19.481894_g1425_i0:92-874(+)